MEIGPAQPQEEAPGRSIISKRYGLRISKRYAVRACSNAGLIVMTGAGVSHTSCAIHGTAYTRPQLLHRYCPRCGQVISVCMARHHITSSFSMSFRTLRP
jgi:hypothetical protein